MSKAPPLGGRSRTGGRPPKRVFGFFLHEQKETRPQAKLVVAKSALLRFHPRAVKTSPAPLLLLSPPKPLTLGFGGGPEAGE